MQFAGMTALWDTGQIENNYYFNITETDTEWLPILCGGPKPEKFLLNSLGIHHPLKSIGIIRTFEHLAGSPLRRDQALDSNVAVERMSLHQPSRANRTSFSIYSHNGDLLSE
jgi:hypothetical protein